MFIGREVAVTNKVMCRKTQFKYCPSTIDSCMRDYIKFLISLNLIPRACCCGHGRYKKTIIVETTNIFGEITNYDLFTGIAIPRKRNFYKKDKEGYYYIPEVEK